MHDHRYIITRPDNSPPWANYYTRLSHVNVKKNRPNRLYLSNLTSVMETEISLKIHCANMTLTRDCQADKNTNKNPYGKIMQQIQHRLKSNANSANILQQRPIQLFITTVQCQQCRNPISIFKCHIWQFKITIQCQQCIKRGIL